MQKDETDRKVGSGATSGSQRAKCVCARAKKEMRRDDKEGRAGFGGRKGPSGRVRRGVGGGQQGAGEIEIPVATSEASVCFKSA